MQLIAGYTSGFAAAAPLQMKSSTKNAFSSDDSVELWK